MDKSERLIANARKNGIDVKSLTLPADVAGIYLDDGVDKLIGLNVDLQTQSEQACVLAEELGHYYTSAGNLLTGDETNVAIIRREELRAKRWATKKLISIRNLIRAYNAGCQSRYEFAEYLGVTEDFLAKAMKQYAEMYGVCKRYGRYTVYFDPPGILKSLERR